MSDVTPPWESGAAPTPPWEDNAKNTDDATKTHTSFGRGQLPYQSDSPEASGEDFANTMLYGSALIPALGAESTMLKGGELLQNAVTKAYPDIAQTLATSKTAQTAAGAAKAITAGATGGAVYGGATGQPIGENALIGAGGALAGKTIEGGIQLGKEYLGKEIPQATKDLQKAAKAAGLNITGKTPEQINTELTDWFKGKTESISGNVSAGTANSEIWPLGKSFTISKNYDKADQAVSKTYDAARAIGKDQHVDAEPVAAGLKSVIDDMEKKAAENIHDPQYAATLAKFKRLYQEIGEGKPSSSLLDAQGQPLKTAIPNTVTGNKLVEIQQELNKRYVAAPERTSQETPYSKLSGVIQNAIKNTSPTFQTAINKANSEWSVFSDTYRNNKVLNQFWTPEDHDAFKALTNRNIPIPVETQKRVYKMLDRIKTPADLEALKLAMRDDPEAYDSIRAAKFYEIMDKAGLDAKVINTNYDVIIKSLEGDPKAIQMVDAIKTLTEQLNQRGIGNLSPAAVSQSESMIARSFRTIMNYATGNKLTFAKKITDLMKEESAGATQQRLTGLKKELNKQPKSVTPPSGKAPIIGTGAALTGSDISSQ